jgi:hypothetical protein
MNTTYEFGNPGLGQTQNVAEIMVNERFTGNIIVSRVKRNNFKEILRM